MGGRQSQEPSPAPLDISPPPSRSVSSGSTHRSSSSHRHSSPHHSTPPTALHHHLPLSTSRESSPRLPTLSDYPNIRPAARPHSQSGVNRLQDRHSLRPSSRTSADQLLELNIALSALQQRLQARAEARERSHSSLHPASLPAGLPLLFFRPVSSKVFSLSHVVFLTLETALQCPVCSKDVPSSEMDTHMSQCVSRPRVTYNGVSSCGSFALVSLFHWVQWILWPRSQESAVSV